MQSFRPLGIAETPRDLGKLEPPDGSRGRDAPGSEGCAVPTSELENATLVEDEPTLESGGWTHGALTIPDSVGPYVIEGELGHGGMSVVFQATHVETGEKVAVKMVRSPNTMNLAALRREIGSLRRVHHPNVVRVLETGIESGRPWYSMPLIEGPTLRAHLSASWNEYTVDNPAAWEHATRSAFATDAGSSGRQANLQVTDPEQDTGLPFRRAVDAARDQLQADSGKHPSQSGRLPAPRLESGRVDAPKSAPAAAAGHLRQILHIFKSLCDTLSVIHGEGLVHRDLKPENVILSAGGEPTIVDFGLIANFGAKHTRETVEGEFQLAGTPGYMAPEQILQELVDARADLYALGCMLYEGLTGRRPFGDAKGLDLVQKQLYEVPAAPSTWARGIPPELDALALRLLERQPQHRVGHASDVAEVLRRVLGDPPSASKTDLRHYLYRPTLAGRLDTLAELEGRLSRSEHGRARLCLIGGPSGMGKTRLAVELMASTARRRLKVFHGECLPLTGDRPQEEHRNDGGDFIREALRGAPLHPFRPFLRAIADICIRDGPATTDELVGDRLPVLAAYAPELKRAPGALRQPASVGLSGEAGQRRLLQNLAETLQALADRGPFLLVLDDIQWADPLSMAFLLALAEGELSLKGMMLVCTYRSEQLSPRLVDLVSACGEDVFPLGPLDREAVLRMVEDMLASERVPSAFVEYLANASSGNPFFIAQYLRTAVEEKLLRRKISGEWIVNPEVLDPLSDSFDSLPLPNSVERLVLHRVERLSSGARRVLEAGSVLARDFDADTIAKLSELDREEVLDSLAELLEQGVVSTSGDATFAFSHDKVRELSYSALDERRRLDLHRRAAQDLVGRLEAAAASSAPADLTLLPLLADHWLAAGNRQRGVAYLIESGRAALDAYAPASAAPFFARALEFIDESGEAALDLSRLERARLERDYAWARYCTGDVEDYLRHSHRALELLGEGTPQSPSGWAWAALTGFTRHCLYGLLPQSLVRTRDESTRARLTLGAQTAAGLSWGYIYGNSPPRALGLSLVAANLSHRAGANGPRAVPYTMLGATWGSVGLDRLADRYFAAARRSAEEVEVVGQAFVQRWIEGMHHFNFARWSRGHELVAEVLERGRASGDAHAMVNSLSILSIEAYHRGQLEACVEFASEARELARANAYAVLETVTRCQLAAVHLHHGRADRALPLLADRAGLDESVEGVMTLITRRAIQAGALMQAGKQREARQAADAAVQLLQANPAGNMTSIMAHFWLASVYMEGLRRARERDEPEDDLAAKVRLTMTWAKRFARMYPIGRPLRLRHEAAFADLEGREKASARLYAKASKVAQTLDMAEEARLATHALRAPGNERRIQITDGGDEAGSQSTPLP